MGSKPTYISDVIKEGILYGLAPVLMKGKRIVMLFACPHCKTNKKMVKFTQPKTRATKTVSACCGHVVHSPKFDHGAAYIDPRD